VHALGALGTAAKVPSALASDRSRLSPSVSSVLSAAPYGVYCAHVFASGCRRALFDSGRG
jgi:hypothetical protein